jgi:hypothetical protein
LSEREELALSTGKRSLLSDNGNPEVMSSSVGLVPTNASA